ncbi:MAG: hypothetical protein ACXAC5_00185 [Promethearchaeota archaeon]|jgi:hypothetical protein
MMSDFGDKVVKGAGIAAAVYGVWCLRKFIVLFVVAMGIYLVVDCTFLNPGDWGTWSMGSPSATAATVQMSKNKPVAQESIWGYSVKDWMKDGRFERAITRYANVDDQQLINDCRDNKNMHACRKLRGKLVHRAQHINND